MLTTETTSTLVQYDWDNKKRIGLSNTHVGRYQHLYFISDDSVIWSLDEEKSFTRKEVYNIVDEIRAEVSEYSKFYSKRPELLKEWFDKNYPQ